MNINELIVRLTEIRDQNAKNWPERNSLPMVMVIEPKVRKARQHHRPSRYYRLKYASSAMTGLPVNDPTYAKRNGLCLISDEANEITPEKGFPGFYGPETLA